MDGRLGCHFFTHPLALFDPSPMSTPRREPMEEDWRKARAMRAEARAEAKEAQWSPRPSEEVFEACLLKRLGCSLPPSLPHVTPEDCAKAMTARTEIVLRQPWHLETQMAHAGSLLDGIAFLRGRAPNLARLVLNVQAHRYSNAISSSDIRIHALAIEALKTVREVVVVTGEPIDPYVDDFWTMFLKRYLDHTNIRVTARSN